MRRSCQQPCCRGYGPDTPDVIKNSWKINSCIFPKSDILKITLVCSWCCRMRLSQHLRNRSSSRITDNAIGLSQGSVSAGNTILRLAGSKTLQIPARWGFFYLKRKLFWDPVRILPFEDDNDMRQKAQRSDLMTSRTYIVPMRKLRLAEAYTWVRYKRIFD